MKIKELISKLQNLNPDLDVVFECSIETGRSVSICEEGVLNILEAGSVIHISIDGEETDYQ